MVHLEVAAWFAQDNLKVIHLQPLKRIIFALLWEASYLFRFGKDGIYCAGRQCDGAAGEVPEED